MSGLWWRTTALSLGCREGRQRAAWDARWAQGAGGSGEVRTFLPGYLREVKFAKGEVHLNTFQR